MNLIRSLSLMLFVALTGCAGRTELMPNSEPALRKTPPQFAADAAKRFPYHADAPRAGDAQARAQIGYGVERIEVVNHSTEDWKDVELWVNRTYVIHLPVMQKGVLKSIPFQAIFNDQGQCYPSDFRKNHIETLEVYKDGALYQVATQLED